jgi:hypothetical protein
MKEKFDSVYPDFLRTGLGKLNQLDARRELLGLFSALEHFRRDLHHCETNNGILEVTKWYISGLNLFHSAGFWLVDQKDFSFELKAITIEDDRELLQKTIDHSIKNGRFAFALRQSAPVFLQPIEPGDPNRGVLHALSLSSQVVGMFCGLLQKEMAPNQEVAFSLLSLLLGEGADALATLHRTEQLTTQVETLSRLLPLCSWCKKFRNDDGYWQQIEEYISSNSSGTAITHGICPECEEKFFSNPDPKA